MLDLASAAKTFDDACGWVTRSLQRGFTTQAGLAHYFEMRPRIRWRDELAELLTLDAAGLHSVLELRYRRDVERPHGLPRGTRQARFRRSEHNEYRDVLYEAYKTAVELDGELAHIGEAWRREARRDNAAAADGINTLRYGWFDVTKSPCQVAAEVARVLERRGFTGARPCSASCPVGTGRRPPTQAASAAGERTHRPPTNEHISPPWRQRAAADAEQPTAAEPDCRINPVTHRAESSTTSRPGRDSIRLARDGRIGQTRRVTASFIPGLELAGLYYAEVVRPLLDEEFPGLRYTAARIGRGSEVLGFDSARSTDHDWGPRLQLFLAGDDEAAGLGRRVTDMLTARLPAAFRGYPTVFPRSGHPGAPPSHRITVAGLRQWLSGALGFDPTLPIGVTDWLSAPTQVLAEITGGAVFYDGLAGSDGSANSDDSDGGTANNDGAGGLGAVRAALAWYPTDIWLHVMACQWQRIAQEEAFPGRCAEAGDDLGSAVVTARLVRDLMRLVLLMHRRYPPYSKWLGTAVARTAAADQLLPALTAAVSAANWPDRERAMSAAYEAAARLHNKIGVTPPVDPAVRPTYYDRPYAVPEAGRFVRALRDQISAQEVRQLPLVGAVDQFIDSTDAIGDSALLRAAVRASVPSGQGRQGTA